MKHEMFVTLADVQEAALRLEPMVNETPIATSRSLTDIVGVDVTVKCENFQRTGSIAFRGAANAIRSLTSDQLSRGVITHSPGNFALALALAARDVKADATVLIPEDITDSKRAAITATGCDIITYDRFTEDPAAKAGDISSERNFTIVPPYDHPDVAAGLATSALELFEEAGGFDAVIVPVNGGATIAGIGTVARALYPGIRVIGVEPDTGNDTQKALFSETRAEIDPPRTIADELTCTSPGTMTLNINQRLIDEIVTVSDADIVAAMCFLFDKMKFVVEPSGAVGIAALLAGKLAHLPGRTAVFLTGGNINHRLFLEHLQAHGAAN